MSNGNLIRQCRELAKSLVISGSLVGKVLVKAARALQSFEWNYDMAAAPKDGTYIHLFVEATAESFVGFWATSMDTGDSDWVIARAKDGTCFILNDEPTAWRHIIIPEETKRVI